MKKSLHSTRNDFDNLCNIKFEKLEKKILYIFMFTQNSSALKGF